MPRSHRGNCLPLAQTHRIRSRSLMRLTGEASGPVPGDFVYRYPASRHPPCAAASQSILLRVSGCAIVGSIPCPKANRFPGIIQEVFCLFGEPCVFVWSQMRRFHGAFSRGRAASARGIPAKSLRTGPAARPALVNSARTEGSWPAPSSTISQPSGVNRRRACAAMAR